MSLSSAPPAIATSTRTIDITTLDVRTWTDFLDELSGHVGGVAPPGGCGACSGCLTRDDEVLHHA